jgi:protocatechuate 3,4-dioxygenase beta subunit
VSSNIEAWFAYELTLQPISGVMGEFIRKNMTGDAAGVPLHLDINLIDVTTCMPMPDTYVELWNANSTVRLITSS